MVSIDTLNGINTYGPPAVAVGEVATRFAGFTINEWFYIVAIICMLMSNITTTIKALRLPKGEANVATHPANP